MTLTADFDLRERIRAANDIVDVVGSTLELRRQGASFVARCPWHDDNKPSLTINPVRQSWRCWPCDIGGDVFSFVMRRDSVNFPEALKILADRAGIDMPTSRAPAQAGSSEDKATLLQAVKWARKQYFDYLAGNSQAEAVRRYVAQRGISSQSVQQFHIGFAPDSWDWLLGRGLQAGFSPQVLHAAGLVVKRSKGSGFYDFFRGRLMFPIHDLQDRPIAFGGRVVPGVGDQGGGKYINTTETLLFSKSQHLYALNQCKEALRRTPHALIMEGYTDVIAAHQHGIDTAVACLGVAVGESHLRLLKRFADRIVLVLDGDEAGMRRADQVLELFVSADVDVRVLTLPDGQDPADFLSTHGTEAFEQLIAEAPDAIEHKLTRSTENIDLVHDTHAATAVLDSLLQLISKSPANSDSLRLQQMVMRLSRTFGLPADSLHRQIASHRHKASLRRRFDAPQTNSAPPPVLAPQRLSPLEGIDRELFELMIEKAELVPLVLEAIDPRWLKNSTAQMLLTIYQDLEIEGHELDVQNVLLAVDDSQLKSLLVAMQQTVDAKAPLATEQAEQRLVSAIDRYRSMQQVIETRQKVSTLESNQMDEADEMALLNQIVNQERNRHKLPPPPSEPTHPEHPL